MFEKINETILNILPNKIMHLPFQTSFRDMYRTICKGLTQVKEETLRNPSYKYKIMIQETNRSKFIYGVGGSECRSSINNSFNCAL